MTRRLAALAAIAAASPFAACAAPCDSLTALTIPNTTITAARIVTPGPLLLPGDRALGAERSLPEYCRVTAVARPVPDSEIRIEIWLPEADQWNGRFLGTSNGRYSSAMSIAQMQSALRHGYAVAGAEAAPTAEYRSIHAMTETGALLIRSYYRRSPEHSYFSGCGIGGKQALTDAQRYPDDYDGIIAGAAAKRTANEADLTAFRKRGGKLLLWHCGEGPGPDVFDALGALDKWVTQGIAPDK